MESIAVIKKNESLAPPTKKEKPDMGPKDFSKSVFQDTLNSIIHSLVRFKQERFG
jgi:hypothetical protein